MEKEKLRWLSTGMQQLIIQERMDVAEQEAREQIARVIESELFRTSEAQRRLLKYLADKSLAGTADQLKEYTIGVDALGKSESYDPRRDSTVRLQSSKLRQKILEYYQTKGQADPILIGFPRGHFKLLFTRRETRSVSLLERIVSNRRDIALLASWVAFAIVAVLCIYWRTSLVRLERVTAGATDTWQPALEEFWGPFLSGKSPTMVCVGAPLFARIPSIGFVRDPRAMNATWEDAESSEILRKLKQLAPGERAEPWYAFTGVGEAGGAFLLSKLLSTRIPALQFAASTALTWNEIGESNIIFVGPPKYNLQIEHLPVDQELVMDSTTGPDGIRNRKPHPGEPAFFEAGVMDAQNQSGHAYAVISRLPGLHGRGEILIIASPWMPGTLGAAQYVTSEPYAKELLGRIRLPSGKLPAYYQVLVAAKFEHWVPVQVSYVLHHVLPVNTNNPAARSNAGQAQ